MNTADFQPEFSPEEIEFISGRRHLTVLLCRMVSFLKLKGFQDCSSDCETFGPDGFQIREDNQYHLDGQQVQVRFKFTHLGLKHLLNVLLTNDDKWNLVIKVRSSVAPETIIYAGIDAEEIETAYLQVSNAFFRATEDVMRGRVLKGHTQVVSIAGLSATTSHQVGLRQPTSR